MFPLDFPYAILHEKAAKNDWVLDPFCGRGTTNYAGRLLGIPSVGIDSSPVAVAVADAKLVNTTPASIIRSAKHILEKDSEPTDVPEGEFWELAYHEEVLIQICKLREALISDCRSRSRRALRAVVLGALHGPRPKTKDSYFSNQSQRTYAPKPDYAVKYWRKHDLEPSRVNVLAIIEERAKRYYSKEKTDGRGKALNGDSRDSTVFENIRQQVKWVITSPPYYGMRTYIPDQWLRNWFLGDVPEVQYSTDGQVEHTSPKIFADELKKTWENVSTVCSEDATMVVRFGGINSRKVDHLSIIRDSFNETRWDINAERSAGFSSSGRRQALHIRENMESPPEEYDVWLNHT